MSVLSPTFFDRDALDVARDLVGCRIVHGPVAVRVTDCEAYRFPGDTANHARAGKTARNAPMWGPPGHAYVYLCYGLHHMLNLVTGPEGHAAAVLIRAVEPVEGLEVLAARRGRTGLGWLDGPGKVAQALGVTAAHSGQPLDGALRILDADVAWPLEFVPRVGIDYASPEDRDAPWRVRRRGSGGTLSG